MYAKRATDTRGSTSVPGLRYVAIFLALASQFVHLWSVPGEFVLRPLVGTFVLVSAAFQGLLAVSLLLGPGRWMLRFGILLNAIMCTVWIVTRFWGYPPTLGFDRLPVEPFGLISAASEVALIALLASVLENDERARRKTSTRNGRSSLRVQLMITMLWIRLGFNMVVYLAALQSIPTELYDAARVDGATGSRRFLYITWPLLRPTTFLLLILNVIYSLHVFDLIYVITGGGPGVSTTVLVQYIYQQAFQESQMGYASAIGVVLYLMLLIFTAFQWWFTRQSENVQ
jgi:ABC-type sugar transport system permease subunit